MGRVRGSESSVQEWFGLQGPSSDRKSVVASALPDEPPCCPVTTLNEGNPGDSEVLRNFGYKEKITHLLCLVIIGFVSFCLFCFLFLRQNLTL